MSYTSEAWWARYTIGKPGHWFQQDTHLLCHTRAEAERHVADALRVGFADARVEHVVTVTTTTVMPRLQDVDDRG